MKNFFLCHSFSGTNSCINEVLPGQHNYTDEQYTKIQVQMVREIWQNYGNLTEIWVDSGTDGLDGMMAQLQPEAAKPCHVVRHRGRSSIDPAGDWQVP